MFFDPSDRVSLKMHAKKCIKAVSPNIYLVGLLFLVITYLGGRVSQQPQLRLNAVLDAPEALEAFLATINMGRILAIGVATFLLSLFLAVVNCGWTLYTLRVSRGEDPGSFDTLFACFKQFGRFVLAQLLMELFIFLWSMLLIIPGIIAAFAYSQTFYIMLDNPDISPREAIYRSRELMYGHKMEYFILGLSFFGWALLSGLTSGLLDIWLRPYMDVTMACYYNGLINWHKEEPAYQEVPPQPDVQEWWKQ